jgi:NADH-quinone oxidoreductase subunit N
MMVLSILTMLIGNLFALRQQNIKRFLAFSSIAQVGFILVGISSNSIQGITSVIYFVFIYIFSNLAAFGVAGLDFLLFREGEYWTTTKVCIKRIPC